MAGGTNKCPPLVEVSRFCDLHSVKEVISFCSIHKLLICESCVSDHQSCGNMVVEIEKTAKTLNANMLMSMMYGPEKKIGNNLQTMEIIISEYNARISALDGRDVEIRKQISDIKSKVISSSNKGDQNKEFMSKLNKTEADLWKELNTKYKECEDKMKATKSDIQCRYDTMQSWRTELKSLMRVLLADKKNLSTKIQFYRAARFLDAKTLKDETELKSFNCSNSKIIFCPPDNSSDVDMLLSSLGSITLGDSLLVSLFNTKELGARVTILKGCFTPDKKLLLSDDNAKTIYVCNYDGSGSTKFKVDYCPKGITIYDKETALIGAWDRGIQTFDLNTMTPGKFIKVGCYVNVITSSMRRICFKRNANTIDIIDINGMLKSKTTTTFPPKDACTEPSGFIYCTDYESEDVISLFGREGTTIYNSSELRNPDGVAVDGNGLIYVAGNLSNNVHRFSRDGKKQEIFLSVDDGIKKPTGLSYNQWTDELLVINDNGKSVKIYKIPNVST